MEDLKALVWNGRVPVSFELAIEEFSDIELKDCIPLYLMISRVSYLALHVEQIAQHFQNELEFHPSYGQVEEPDVKESFPPSGMNRLSIYNNTRKPVNVGNYEKIRQFVENNVWFTCGDQPLKWHYSLGVLFDLYGSGGGLPWKIIIHFDNYPSELLLSPPINRQSMEILFMSLVKEADWLKHRGLVIEKMQPRDHKQLWSSLCTHKYDKFWAINRKLMSTDKFPVKKSTSIEIADHCLPPSEEEDEAIATEIVRGQDSPSDNKDEEQFGFRHIPCKVYWKLQPLEEDKVVVVQKLVKPFSIDEKSKIIKTTVGDVYLNLRPNGLNLDMESLKQNYTLIVHGIECKSDTQLQWASENFSHPDNFLHFIAKPREDCQKET